MSFTFPLIPRQHRVEVHTTCGTPGCVRRGADMHDSLDTCPSCRQRLVQVVVQVEQEGDR